MMGLAVLFTSCLVEDPMLLKNVKCHRARNRLKERELSVIALFVQNLM